VWGYPVGVSPPQAPAVAATLSVLVGITSDEGLFFLLFFVLHEQEREGGEIFSVSRGLSLGLAFKSARWTLLPFST